MINFSLIRQHLFLSTCCLICYPFKPAGYYVPQGLILHNVITWRRSSFIFPVWFLEQSDYFCIQHQHIGFYNRGGVFYCALRKDSFSMFQIHKNRVPFDVKIFPLTHSVWDLCSTKWHRDKFLSEYFGFPLSISFHQRYILIFIYMFLLPGGQMGIAWEPTKKQCSFGNRGALDRKYFN
jgi:hypothetical protein